MDSLDVNKSLVLDCARYWKERDTPLWFALTGPLRTNFSSPLAWVVAVADSSFSIKWLLLFGESPDDPFATSETILTVRLDGAVCSMSNTPKRSVSIEREQYLCLLKEE